MMTLVLLLLLTLAFVAFNMSAKNWLITASVVFALSLLTGVGWAILNLIILLVVFGMWLLLYPLPAVRKTVLTGPLFAMVKKMMPPISETEKAAIDAGSVWWDAEIFSGNPDWQTLFAVPKQELTDQEKAFLEGQTETLCKMVCDWEVTHELNDLPQNVWDYILENKFFALNASRDYGGLGFSAYAQSCILQKLASRSGALAVTVMVPNSLGPAELLYHYGTQEQKNQYLPRLNEGKEIPCFGLTNPWAGSDAGGMTDFGIVCEREQDGQTQIGFKITWEKRYITLGPVATLLGLAFKAYDPDGLLGDKEDLGITCVLIPTDTDGVNIGDRHNPLNSSFQNGPNSGDEVFVPIDWVIGGRDRIGQGWRMLMESLSAGRGISLPAAAAGGATLSVRMSGAYCAIREQFGLPIGKFEGVAEALARIGGLTYLLNGGRRLMTAGLAAGEKPAVMSAIVKQQCTDLSRIVINDAMDVHGGKGICMGPNNYLARMYQQIPIGITVEGANILTRSLIIFGQGSMRCHPYLLQEINAVTSDNEEQGKIDFDLAMRDHIVYMMSNKMRSFALGLSRGKLSKVDCSDAVKTQVQRINHLSASFSFLADCSLLLLGGELKRKEMLSGRFADVLSNLYLASASIKQFQENGEDEEEKVLLDWSCGYALYQAQQALDAILRNYPVPILGHLLRVVIFPSGRYLRSPSDKLSQAVAELLQTPSELRDRITANIYIGEDDDATKTVELAFDLAINTLELRKRLRKQGDEPAYNQSYEKWLDELVNAEKISQDEYGDLIQYRKMVRRVIDVDQFEGQVSLSI